MNGLAKTLIILGLTITALGAMLMFADKVPWLGRLPGDIHIKRENFSVYFPLATSILLSILLSLILWLFRR